MAKRIGQIVTVLSLILLVFNISETRAECGVCQENEAACINSTSFYLCFGEDSPNTEKLYHCLEGLECTDLTAICTQKSYQRPASCGDTAQCGLCSAHRNYLFTCHSRGIYQYCFGASRPTGDYGYCDEGYVCDASSDLVCVPEDEVTDLTCDILDELVDTSTTSTTTSTTTTTEATTSNTTTTESSSLTASEICEKAAKTGLYPTVPADPYCKKYVYCYYKNAVKKATDEECADNSYFEADLQRCSYVKSFECL